MQCTGKRSTAAITQINNTNGIIVMRYFTEFTPSSKITSPVPNSLQFHAYTLFLAVLKPNHSSSPTLYSSMHTHTFPCSPQAKSQFQSQTLYSSMHTHTFLCSSSDSIYVYHILPLDAKFSKPFFKSDGSTGKLGLTGPSTDMIRVAS